MKRGRPDDHEGVFGRGRSFQQVLAPAPGGLPSFDNVQDSIASSLTQFGTSQMATPGYPVQTQQAQNHGQGHQQAQTHAHVQAQTQGQQQQQQFQRLKVEDALSYLDQVKLQFGNQPQVYNHFLDIMKEFKSQSIDTPGVISRVSTLFKGHPELIVGFNTFLPPGYKIEAHATDPGSVSVTAPTGLTQICAGVNIPMEVQQLQGNQNQGYQSQSAKQHQVQQHSHSQQQNQSNSSSQPNQSQQPVEFNHAINYVNKIKNRFQGQPEIYKAFLEILHTYQKEQKNIKEAAMQGTPLSEQEIYVREAKLANEVYKQVAKLFQNQEDLLKEFSQFLPDANGATSGNQGGIRTQGLIAASGRIQSHLGNQGRHDYAPPLKKQAVGLNSSKRLSQIRRGSSGSSPSHAVPSKKKSRSVMKEVSLAEAGKHGTFTEYAFFDKVRKALKSPEVYDNFLRCLMLFNDEVISRAELVQLGSNFLGKFPELFTWFKEFLGYKDSSPMETMTGYKERTSGELAHLEIDYSSCKRYGTSYRALPKSYTQPKCSGRSDLCRDVLNDTWVSFPSWSEDTPFPGTRKTQYEEYIYRCEDERFENRLINLFKFVWENAFGWQDLPSSVILLANPYKVPDFGLNTILTCDKLDVVLESNAATIRSLEAVQKRMTRMSPEEQQKFRMDSCLGGTSEVVHKKAIQRIYGDKAPDIIDGLKKTPVVAVPLVLKRLRAKEEEWRESQRQFNKIWKEQNEKYYLKSLDHQGITFKQNDLKAMRSKSLVNEIETIFDEKQEQAAEGSGDASGPHMIFTYQDKSILDDAAGLVVHHVKRQTSIHKEEKAKIKLLLHCFIPDLLFAPRGDLSDDEESVKEMNGPGKPELSNGLGEGEADDAYNLFFINNNWYIFLRLHQNLCDRLQKMYLQSVAIAEGEASDKQQRKEATAIALRLKAPSEIDLEEYYPAFLDMVKNVLDGNMDSTTYEDTCREMFGVYAYIAFTMDKLVQHIVRQLHTLVTDETGIQITELYQQEQSNSATGGSSATQHLRAAAEASYQSKAESILSDENCYKAVIHKDKNICKVSLELLDTGDSNSEDPLEVEKWNDYVQKYVGSEEVSPEVKEHLQKKPLFLPRTIQAKRTKPIGNSGQESTNDNGSSTDEAESEVNKSDKEEEDGDDIEDMVENSMQCKLSLNSYKMRFVAGSWESMYRRGALTKAKKCHPQVMPRLHKKFHKWLDEWMESNVTDEMEKSCENWLLGKTEDLKPCTTAKQRVPNTPIQCYKYTVKWEPTPTPTS